MAEGKHLLVVDDESSLLMMLQDSRRNKGFVVHAFQSAKEALVYLKRMLEMIE